MHIANKTEIAVIKIAGRSILIKTDNSTGLFIITPASHTIAQTASEHESRFSCSLTWHDMTLLHDT